MRKPPGEGGCGSAGVSQSPLPHLVPETGVMKPLQELLAHDHGAGEEGPVGQQEVFDVGGVHH